MILRKGGTESWEGFFYWQHGSNVVAQPLTLNPERKSAVPRVPILLTFLLLLTAPLGAQSRLRLFLDCHTSCDSDFLRTEIPVVDWVNDAAVADLHVIATSLSTGSGGTEVTLEFLGRGALADQDDRHSYTTAADASDDDRRREMARVLRLGLVRYLLASGQAAGLDLELGGAATVTPTIDSDPWNRWIFSTEVSGGLDGESRELSYQLGTELRASRVTADWKFEFELEAEIDRSSFELDDGKTFTARRDGWNSDLLLVKALGPHWSVGGELTNWSYRPDNLDYRARIAPAIEWNLYPYAEATRRQMIVRYTLGYNRFRYVEETIYDRLTETRADHQLAMGYESRQPWGDAHLSASVRSYLHDWSLNRLGVSAGLDVRITRGLELELSGGYSRVRDQITLPKGDASDEEIFLRLRELATGYQAEVEVGLSYSFGSVHNSVVNPRFPFLD